MAAARLVLLLLPLAAALATAAPTCHTYTSKGLIQPGTGSLQDVIVVQDAFVAGDASVTLEVSHRRVGALKITLGAAPFSNSGAPASAAHPAIILKGHGQGRRGQDLYRATFSDGAAAPFPINASYAPFTGAWRPVQKLAFLTDGEGQTAGAGGSQGLWTLTIADVAPNNSLRDIALNGWTLVLCERGAALPPSPEPSPSPSPLPPASPAPPVVGFDGPPASPTSGSGSGTGSGSGSGSGAVTGAPTSGGSIFGWQVVYKPVEGAPAGAPAGAPTQADADAGAGAGAALPQTWQQLMGKGPILTYMEQQLTAIASGIGGQCDAACQEAKQKLWRAAIFGMYVRSALAVHHRLTDPNGDRPSWTHTYLQKMQDFLPGDNKRLAALQAWLDKNHDDMQQLGLWLHDHLRLPNVTALHLNLPKLGGGSGLQLLQEAFSSGGTRLQAFMDRFATAGDRLGALASGMLHLTTNMATGTGSFFKQLGQLYGNRASDMAALFQQGAGRLAEAVASGAVQAASAQAGVAGAIDDRGTALYQFFNSLNGKPADQVTQQALAGLTDVASQLADLFDFSL